MSLTDLLAHGQPAGQFNKVMAAYNSLTADEQEAFRALVQDPLWTGPQIALALRQMGFDIQGDQVKAFRASLRNGRVTL